MKPDRESGPLDSYVDALLQCTGQLTLIINHMTAYPSPPDVAPFDEVIRNLLTETLGQEVTRRRPPMDVEAAAAFMAETVDAIGRNLFLVGPGAFDEPDCDGMPARRRRR